MSFHVKVMIIYVSTVFNDNNYLTYVMYSACAQFIMTLCLS
jgi:hypothetical protein